MTNGQTAPEKILHSNQSGSSALLESQVISQPNSVQTIREVADSYADQNCWIEAIQYYETALRLDAANSDLYNSIGIAYEEVGRIEDAEKAYQQAIILNVKDPMPYYNLGIMYEKQLRILEAIQAYKKCLEYSSDSSERSEVKNRIIVLASETPTGQSRLAYFLAAGILFLNLCFEVIALLRGSGLVIAVSGLVDLVLAIGLLQLKSGARSVVFFRAFVGAIAIPILTYFMYTGGNAAVTLLVSLIQWSYCGALILLLTGESKTWRLVLAIGIFLVFSVGISGILGLLAVLNKMTGIIYY